MSKRVLCKFFAHGACLKGEHCEFSHDWTDPPNNICTYYQKGLCSYGSRCRYDHVKPSRPEYDASSSSSMVPRQSPVSNSVSIAYPARTGLNAITTVPCAPADLSALSRPFFPSTTPAWDEQNDILEEGDVIEAKHAEPEDRPLCSFAAVGSCPRGDKCHHVHGDLCPTCGKHCLHPFRPQVREEHSKACEKKQKQLELLKFSQEIECSVCLDRVLSKPTAAERKFGLLSECDHPFCISCIRNWRSSSPTSGMDVNSSLRACPICRKLSYYVIPSVIWYSSKEEKEEIVDSYKSKLSSIDCKHFDFGNGNCPFGASCFYKHTVKPGSYTWKYLHPPPRRSPPRWSNVVDMDALYDMFEHLIGEDERRIFDAGDFYDENLTPMEMALLLMELGIGSGNSSSDEETYAYQAHAYRDGRLEEVALRHLGAEDGETVIAKNIRLSDFLSNLQIL